MSRPMVDVLFFLSSLSRFGGGGVSKNTVRLAKELRQRGLSVEIVVATTPPNHLPRIEGVPVHTLFSRNRWLSMLPLALYLRRHRPRAVIGATQLVNCVLIAARIISKYKGKVIVTERSTLSAEIATQDHWTFRLLPYLMRFLYPHADALVAVSNGVATDLAKSIRLSVDQIGVIYNPVVSQELVQMRDRETSHVWFDEGHPPIILGAGRLALEKDFETLIKAFSRVRETCDARLVILGEGASRSQLERLVDELEMKTSVAFLGHVSNPYPYMKKSKVFVLSSLYEGFGNVLVEAMACGVPVVSTECPGGPAEILENGRWGKMVPVGDVDAMGNAIVETLRSQSPNVTERAGYFTVERAADAYIDLLDSIED